ncbi:MAG: bifunctional salicylyl-CoA 5-hydroxylase/oxidoreductase [Actinomycetota bacterium]|nr:bifunctional salicylyl-CoA 5-hydroxylase/oxidoreductase [Actinomycetota bacterium]
MKILSIGGGAAGLYFGILMKKLDPSNEITVLERNRPYDTFGWGVVFSDQTLSNFVRADEPTARTILQSFNHWDDIDVRINSTSIISGGHGFCGIGRKRLLNILQERAEGLGVKLVFEADIKDDQEAARQYGADLVIAADGLNSAIRTRYASTFKPDIDTRKCRFVWLGTKKLFKDFTFIFENTEFGWFQAHIYQFDGDTSTFIVETPEDVWLRAGIDEMSQEESIAFCEKLFAKHLDGAELMSNAAHLRGSASWIKFPRVICENWVQWNSIDGKEVPVVLMGDAAHTAHFSIGSGTKLAMEDAIELANSIAASTTGDMHEILASYQETRAIEVLKIQNAARNAMEWFEETGRYTNMPPEQFNFSLLTRSQRISHDNLRVRDADFIAKYDKWFATKAFADAGLELPTNVDNIPPMFTPFKVRDVVLKNRVVVSPMAQYSSEDGLAADYHLVHLGARAMGGAGMVFTEMTCVSADARITPGCPGLYKPEHTIGWKRIVDFVHSNSDAKIAVQIGHAGAKGATKLAWDGMDKPVETDSWPLISASPEQYLAGVSQTSREMTRADMDRVKQDFINSTKAAEVAGFDWLELHAAHGYLLSSFISPITNRRSDEYGGSLENRMKYPLEIFAAVREVWPEGKPISVRISAHDWTEGGITPQDAVEIAKAFKAAGADLIDCSSGQVTKREKPVFGRMFQTPFADQIRNEAGIATIAVGAIFEADNVNTIIAAGRADLCAVARMHLVNPAWTLLEAAKIGYKNVTWPKQYISAKVQIERNIEREKQMAATAKSSLSYEQITASFDA